MVSGVAAVLVRPLSSEDAPRFAHLATGFGQGRLTVDRDGLIALGAYAGSEPAGLFLGALHNDAGNPRLLSIMTLRVAERYRRQGIGTSLLASAEEAARARNCDFLYGLLADGSPAGLAAHALAARAGFTRCRLASTFYKVSCETMASSHWVTRTRSWPGDFEVFPWRDLSAGERSALLARREDPLCFDPALDPFVCESQQTPNSVGLRVRGEIAGWAVSWYLSPDPVDCRTMRGTRLFVRGDLQRRGFGVMLLAEHMRCAPAAGFDYALFSVVPGNHLMHRLLNRHMAPSMIHSREIWGMRKPVSSKV